MRIKKLAGCLIATVFAFGACTLTKQAVSPPNQIISAVTSSYHGSYPKLTDLLHTKLDLSFNWDSAFVIGKAVIEARPYFYPQSEIVLNANGFKVNKIALQKKDDEQTLKYSYDGKLLKIQLDKEYTREQKYVLLIDYVAMPNKLIIGKDIASENDKGFYFINPTGKDTEKPRQFWTQGETECNSNWFPTINDPQEKMTQEISLTVPNDMVTLSNGEMDFSSNNGDGTKTDTWRQEKPHSTYLTMIAAGNFTVTRDKWRDKEVSYFVEPKFAPYSKLVFGHTPEMIEFFSKKTGVDYPWDKYSQIVVRDFVGGAMENTSATVFYSRMNMNANQYLDETYEDVISHELFHHWFGDLVTCESWSNLPLNESFATYGEYLWNEFKYGLDDADYFGMKDQEIYLNSATAKQMNVIRFNYSDREQMFDDVSYQKGGRILHMLRKTVGDEAFFKSLNLYLTRNAYKTAEIHDLRLAFEEITGQDLNWFFNQWFLASGHPVLAIQTSYNPASSSATVNIKQLQNLTNTPLYRIPMAVDIYTASNKERKHIVLDKQDQTFTFQVSAAPQLINVDAEKYVLAEKSENKSVVQYQFQYEHAPLFLDRYEAISKLSLQKKDKTAHQEMIKALEDKNWYIRQMAVNFVSDLELEEKTAVYQKVKNMALADPRSYVRAAAIKMLAKAFPEKDNKEIFDKAALDKAPSVLSAINSLHGN